MQNNQTFLYPSIFLGTIWILQLVWRFTAYIFRQCIRPNLLHPRDRQAVIYNKKGGAWAVITGGTDGIGEGFAKNLAKQGFNICIVSRNPEKINKKLAEIKKHAGREIETMGITCDFSQVYTIQDYQTTVVDKVKDLDVAFLILNAGIGQVGSILKMEDQFIQDLCNVNVLHVMYLTKLMLPQLSQRLAKVGQKSAMVVTSSIAANNPIAGFVAYSASKSFETFVAESCHYEFEDTIDVISYRPSAVESALNKRREDGDNKDMITSDQAAVACFAQLGHTEWTQGHHIHELTGFILELMPRAQTNRWIYPQMVKEQERRAGDWGNKKSN